LDPYDKDLENESVLLQGVVDCAIMEEKGITILDFKTDYVTEETVIQAAMRYAPQVNAYAGALSRIFEKEIVGKALYFFRLNRFVWL
jgi:ATP-dependent helicase/nuclease subunit A